MSRKKKVSVYDDDVVAPDRLDISTTTRNPAVLMNWYADAMLYLEAMEAIGRAVLMKRDDDTLHLSSIDAGQP